jgi:stage II sporulation protein AA (anti-sigma F factor antagonist)
MGLSATDLRITTARIGRGACLVSVAGELDAHTSEILKDTVWEALSTDAPLHLIVDLLAVSFIDSRSLGVLTGGAKLARAGGGDLVVVSDDVSILRTLEITGLDRHLRVERSLASAIDSLARPAVVVRD